MYNTGMRKIEENLKSKNQPAVNSRGACLVDSAMLLAYAGEAVYILTNLRLVGENLPLQIFLGSVMILQGIVIYRNGSLWGPNDGQ